MTLKQLLIIVATATAICGVSLAFVIFNVDPTASGALGLLLFYASVFFTLLGLFFIIMSSIRKLKNKTELEHIIVASSFRQSFFFSLIVIGGLFLQSKHFLTWWNMIILVVAIGLMEYFFLSFKRESPQPKPPEDETPLGYIPPDF